MSHSLGEIYLRSIWYRRYLCASITYNAVQGLLHHLLIILHSDDLKAPIKMAHCGHSFCNECLIAYVRGAGRWECPKCRKITNSTVEELPRNFDLENIVESLSNIQIQPNTEFGFCDRNQTPIKLRKLNVFNSIWVIAYDLIPYEFRLPCARPWSVLWMQP